MTVNFERQCRRCFADLLDNVRDRHGQGTSGSVDNPQPVHGARSLKFADQATQEWNFRARGVVGAEDYIESFAPAVFA